jgi:hypothetical protein
MTERGKNSYGSKVKTAYTIRWCFPVEFQVIPQPYGVTGNFGLRHLSINNTAARLLRIATRSQRDGMPPSPRPFCQSEEVHIISIDVNGSTVELPTDARLSLLDFLRDRLQLYGSKKGCDQGACGACTVLVDGERILSCLALAVRCEDRKITTVERTGRRKRSTRAAGGLQRRQCSLQRDRSACPRATDHS